MEVVELERIKKRFSRAAETYEANAKAQMLISDHLARLIDEIAGSEFSRLLEVGCGSGAFTKAMMRRLSVDEWVVNDLCESWRESIELALHSTKHQFVVGDIERLSIDGSFNIIVSASALQWINDLPALFRRFSSLLTNGGILAFNTFLPDNLLEVKSLTGEGLHYPTKAELLDWLSERFDLLYDEEQTIQLSFSSPLEVLRHLKRTGVTANSSSVWTRGRQQKFCEDYSDLFPSEDGGVTLTYRPLYILARRV